MSLLLLFNPSPGASQVKQDTPISFGKFIDFKPTIDFLDIKTTPNINIYKPILESVDELKEGYIPIPVEYDESTITYDASDTNYDGLELSDSESSVLTVSIDDFKPVLYKINKR